VPNNPGLNLDAFADQSPNAAPPPINALYLRDGQYDGMTRSDVTATFEAFRAQTLTKRLALFFHGGLVDKASGQQSAANQFLNYAGDAFPLFFIWESGFGDVLSHHLPLIFAETIFRPSPLPCNVYTRSKVVDGSHCFCGEIEDRCKRHHSSYAHNDHDRRSQYVHERNPVGSANSKTKQLPSHEPRRAQRNCWHSHPHPLS
jgi:hypothetical protein